MDSAVISLLTIGLPTAASGDKKALADIDTDTPELVSNNDGAQTTPRFQDVLASAGLQQQPLTPQRLSLTTDTTVSDTTHSLEASFFKKLAEDSGKDVVAAVLPPTSIPLDQVPWQKSFVASVSFAPSVAPPVLPASLPQDTIPPPPPVDPDTQALATSQNPLPEDALSFSAAADSQATASLPSLENAAIKTPLPAEHSPQIDAGTDTKGTDAVALIASPALAVAAADPSLSKTNGNESLKTSTQEIVLSGAKLVPTIPTAPLRTIIHHFQEPSVPSDEEETEPSTSLPKGLEGSGEAVKSSALKGSVLPSLTSSAQAASLSSTIAPEKMIPSTIAQGSNEVFAAFLGTALRQKNGSEETLSSEDLSSRIATAQPFHIGQSPETSLLKFSVDPKASGIPSASEQISLHIVQAKATKTDKITITMHPAELGKVEIRMHMDAHNNTKISIQTESRDTYQLLQADRSNLERILQDSGLKMDSNHLQFGYHGSQNETEHSGGQGFSGNTPDQQAPADKRDISDRDIIAEPVTTAHIALSVTTGVNIRV